MRVNGPPTYLAASVGLWAPFENMSALRATRIGEDISIMKLLELLVLWILSIYQCSKEDNGLENGFAYILS
jgi:hypothetical protein